MKNNYLLLLRHPYVVISISVLIISILVFSGCSQQKDESKDWLNLNIRFKKNTTEAIRQASLNAIEKEIIDTVKQLHNKHNNFNPFISRIQNSVDDSLNFIIKVTSTKSDTLAICYCPNTSNCKPCRISRVLPIKPIIFPEFISGDYIDTLFTLNDGEKINPGRKN